MVDPRFREIYFQFYKETYKPSVLDRKTKELIAIAASLAAKCQGCLEGHVKKALKFGATREEISESIAIAIGVNAAAIVDLTDIAAENIGHQAILTGGLTEPSLQEKYAPQSICFGCGPANDKGLRIRSILDGGEVVARLDAGAAPRGLPGHAQRRDHRRPPRLPHELDGGPSPDGARGGGRRRPSP